MSQPTRLIALFGACATERSALAQGLSARLAQHGLAAALVADPDEAWPAAQDGTAITLLLAITPSPAIPLDAALAARDAHLRAALLQARVAFCVVHGRGTQALDAAWAAILAGHGMQDSMADRAKARPWAWTCDKCSDPACEHLLFTRLVGARKAAATAPPANPAPDSPAK